MADGSVIVNTISVPSPDLLTGGATSWRYCIVPYTFARYVVFCSANNGFSVWQCEHTIDRRVSK